jgi:hypothetical protein
MGGKGSGPGPNPNWKKGAVTNPEGNGRRNWTPSKTARYWELKTAMRELAPQAVEVVRKCLGSDDERIALMAAEIAFERGFGKAVVHADVEINHRFVVAPAVMPVDQWLARKGQPEGRDGDAWLLEHEGEGVSDARGSPAAPKAGLAKRPLV